MTTDENPSHNASSSLATTRQVGIRSLIAVTGALAFVAAGTRLLVELRIPTTMIVVIIVPSATCALIGTTLTRGKNHSTLLGSMIGGGLGVLIATLVFWFLFAPNYYYSYFERRDATFLFTLASAICLCGSGVIGGMIGIIREGVAVRREQ